LFNCDIWAFCIAGGYDYNKQRVRTGSGETLFAGIFFEDPLYDGLVFKQCWQGPWLGAKAFLYTCGGWLVDLGYEYHFAHYHASFNIPSTPAAEALDFSDKRSGKNAYGNVVTLNARKNMWENIDVGLGFAYKQFRTRHCKMAPQNSTFVQQGYPEGTTGSAKSKWISYTILADLGYSF
jgi:hypothetical protein